MLVVEITKLSRSTALILPLRSRRMRSWFGYGAPDERVRQMWNIVRRPIAATLAAIAFGNVGIGSAAAADIPTPPSQVQPPPPDYYASPPAGEGYIYPPPVVYGYPPPPPTSYYEYGAPPVVIVPRPFYLGRHYGSIYGDHPYVQGPYAARGYGRYDPQWGRGHRGW
jgi:hypothetical protein